MDYDFKKLNFYQLSYYLKCDHKSNKMQFLQQILIFSILMHSTLSDNLNPCDDWEPYKDEKCLKIFNAPGLLAYEDAENLCKTTDDSNLISIGLEEKQMFIENLLRSNAIVDYVWIGLKYVNGHYEWTDGTELHFTNWAVGSPKNDSEHCPQIITDEQEFGKWSDIPCSKKNLVICEKIQPWSLSHIQNSMIELLFAVNQSKEIEKQLDGRISGLETSNGQLETRFNGLENAEKELEGRVSQLESSNDQLATRLSNLENSVNVISQNPFPVGFIYAQLPNEQSPSEIWPWMGWQDVSSNYAGVFFRVEGGGSAAFGSIQEENSPRLTHVHRADDGTPAYMDIDIIANGQPSNIIDEKETDHGRSGLQFTESGGEVRPRNMAIRIWKRIQ